MSRAALGGLAMPVMFHLMMHPKASAQDKLSSEHGSASTPPTVQESRSMSVNRKVTVPVGNRESVGAVAGIVVGAGFTRRETRPARRMPLAQPGATSGQRLRPQYALTYSRAPGILPMSERPSMRAVSISDRGTASKLALNTKMQTMVENLGSASPKDAAISGGCSADKRRCFPL